MIYLRGWIDGELQLWLLPVVDGEPFHEEGGEPRPGAPAEGVEDEEALQPRTHIRQLPQSVQHQVHDLLLDGVVAPRVVVGRVLLPCDQLLGVEQLTVRTGSNLI